MFTVVSGVWDTRGVTDCGILVVACICLLLWGGIIQDFPLWGFAYFGFVGEFLVGFLGVGLGFPLWVGFGWLVG